MAVKSEIRSAEHLSSVDPIWDTLKAEARIAADHDPYMGTFLYSTVINHKSLEDAVIYRICERLDHADMPAVLLRQTFEEMCNDNKDFSAAIRADIQAYYDRDPVCTRFIEPVLYFKGFHAIQTYRLANWLLRQGRKDFALYLQSRSSSVFQTDINPAARIGKGFFLDHATGLVVGETAAIGDNVSILQGVTLGGTGKEAGDRHPKIGNGVLIGAGAKVLGNITVGDCSRIAAGSVVLKPVPRNTTVAGVPARIMGEAGCSEPSRSMDQVQIPSMDI